MLPKSDLGKINFKYLCMYVCNVTLCNHVLQRVVFSWFQENLCFSEPLEMKAYHHTHKLHWAITYISNVASNLISKYYFDRPYQLRFVLPIFNPCDNIVFF